MRCLYSEFHRLIGDEFFNRMFVKYVTVFMFMGDLEGALLRAQAASSVLQDTAAPLTRIMIAFVKNLNGDYADWLALEEDAQNKILQKNERRTVEKKEEHASLVVAIQQHQLTTEEQLAQDIQTKKEKDKAKKARNKANQKAKKEAAAKVQENDDRSEAETSVSSAEEKQAKLQRHELNERERAERTANMLQTESMTMPSEIATSPTPPNTALETITDPIAYENKLSDCLNSNYVLRGVALKVNEAIRTGEWNFTRSELESYFLAMGCIKKQGKGSHEKVQMPSAVTFLQADKVISILCDLGGALTLPKWDEVVPHYLRKKIQVARENLKDLTRKA